MTLADDPATDKGLLHWTSRFCDKWGALTTGGPTSYGSVYATESALRFANTAPRPSTKPAPSTAAM